MTEQTSASVVQEAQSQKEAKPVSAMERLDNVELNSNANRQMVQYLMNKITDLESALAGLAKTISGTVKALTSKQLVSDEDIMKHVRDIDDRSAKEQVQALIKAKIIQISARIGTASLAVVGRQMLASDGKVLNLSEYSLVSMPHVKPEAEEFKTLLGKSIGERYELKANGGVFVCLVKEVYDYLPDGSAQAQPPAQEEAPAPGTSAAAPAEPPASTDAQPATPEATPSTTQAQ